MGLDMYAMITSETPNKPVDFEYTETAGMIHSWRKHPDLHGWMQQLYFDKGGQQEFNCVPVVLTATDLDQLEAAIVDRELPETSGFFFGNSFGEEHEDDLEFITKARKAIADGYTVFYDSWW